MVERLVDVTGIEPVTPCLWCRRSWVRVPSFPLLQQEEVLQRSRLVRPALARRLVAASWTAVHYSQAMPNTFAS